MHKSKHTVMLPVVMLLTEKILRSKIYIGKIPHKDEVHEGLHEGIIDEKLFNKVQKSLMKIQLRQIIPLALNIFHYFQASYLMIKII